MRAPLPPRLARSRVKASACPALAGWTGVFVKTCRLLKESLCNKMWTGGSSPIGNPHQPPLARPRHLCRGAVRAPWRDRLRGDPAGEEQRRREAPEEERRVIGEGQEQLAAARRLPGVRADRSCAARPVRPVRVAWQALAAPRGCRARRGSKASRAVRERRALKATRGARVIQDRKGRLGLSRSLCGRPPWFSRPGADRTASSCQTMFSARAGESVVGGGTDISPVSGCGPTSQTSS